MKKISNKYYRWLIELTLILIVLSSIQWWMTRDAVKGVAPEFKGLLLNDKVYDSETIDKPMLIYFWATWCPICSVTSPNINSLYQEDNKDYEIITIAMQSGNPSEIKAYLNENEFSFPVLNDTFGELANKFRVKGVPTFYILDKNRNVVSVERGYTSELGLRFRLWWAAR